MLQLYMVSILSLVTAVRFTFEPTLVYWVLCVGEHSVYRTFCKEDRIERRCNLVSLERKCV